MRYRKLPVEIEAIEWTGQNVAELKEFTRSSMRPVYLSPSGRAVIPTREGDMRAKPGDFIIRGVAGEFYPCSPEIFARTYEKVEEDDTPDEDQQYREAKYARERDKREVSTREVRQEPGHLRDVEAAGNAQVAGGGD